MGLAYYVTLLLCCPTDVIEAAPPQWPIIIYGGTVGFLGSLVDSILGATFQYSGRLITGSVFTSQGP